mmetsp:Transcript_127167/g.354094  ORF Transcript_127167/g.354094 Transcript_127167/m.354094 type:complete len:275 (-) Transcript_127167:112-936(-)
MGGRFSRDAKGNLTMDDVGKHVTKDDAWLVLFGEVIDVTRFIPLHPGGEDMMMAYLGKDATEDWQKIHSPDTLEKYVEHLGKMGRIKADGSLLSWLWARLGKADGQTPAAERPPPEEGQTAEGEGAEAEAQEAEPVKWTAEHEAELPPGSVFDLKELARWDGVQLPMCIGICGMVVDVSSSQNFVPNFGYGKLWAGKDTTWAMATVSLKVEDANRFDFKLEDLSEEQFKALAGWFKHFTTKYRTVGTLRELEGRDFGPVVRAAEELPVSSMSQG